MHEGNLICLWQQLVAQHRLDTNFTNFHELEDRETEFVLIRANLCQALCVRPTREEEWQDARYSLSRFKKR